MRLSLLAVLVLVFTVTVHAQAPIELQHGEQITISCAPSAGGCGDGVCGPGEDCAACPADCGVCPPSGGPPAQGLAFRHRWDVAHAVQPGVTPAQTICNGCTPPAGSWTHHLHDLATDFPVREATEVDPRWGPIAQLDGLEFDGDDQLLFQTCTSLDPLVCSFQDWRLSATQPWAIYLVASISRDGYILGFPNDGGVEYSYISVASSGAWKIRIENGTLTPLGSYPLNQRGAAVLERLSDGTFLMHHRAPCQPWADVTVAGAAAQPGRRPGFGCWSCYYRNEWGGDPPLSPGIFSRFREGGGYEWEFSASERQDLFNYLDAEHGAWIDAGC